MMCSKVWIVSNRPFPNRVASNPEELDRLIQAHEPELPKRIYFPFWSWKVPAHLIVKCDCIGFHSAPLPFGKGGSPIQNMIRAGYDYTEVCAFIMNHNFDCGKILMRRPITLFGSLGNIIKEATSMIEFMISKLEGIPFNLKGKQDWEIKRFEEEEIIDRERYFARVPLKFERITDNLLPETDTLKQIYDEIRMRDEEGHPKAYKYHGRFKIYFTNAEFKDGKVTAKVEINKG